MKTGALEHQVVHGKLVQAQLGKRHAIRDADSCATIQPIGRTCCAKGQDGLQGRTAARAFRSLPRSNTSGANGFSDAVQEHVQFGMVARHRLSIPPRVSVKKHQAMSPGP